MERELLIHKLKDLHKQATTENSHYYTASLLAETILFLETELANQLESQVVVKLADTLDLTKAFEQCKGCCSNWNYRGGKQDQGWCYSKKE